MKKTNGKKAGNGRQTSAQHGAGGRASGKGAAAPQTAGVTGGHSPMASKGGATRGGRRQAAGDPASGNGAATPQTAGVTGGHSP